MNKRPPGPPIPNHMTVTQYRWTELSDPALQAQLNTRRIGRALAARSREMGVPISIHPHTNEHAYREDVWQSVLARDGGRYFDTVTTAGEVEARLAKVEARLAKAEAQLEVMALALRGSK
jgi:hypothetical protein